MPLYPSSTGLLCVNSFVCPWSAESFPPLMEAGRVGGIGVRKKPLLDPEDPFEHDELRQPEEEEEEAIFFGDVKEGAVVYAPGPGMSCVWSFHLTYQGSQRWPSSFPAWGCRQWGVEHS